MARISGREFQEWMAYDRIDPIGNERADLNAAMISANIVSALSGKKVSVDDVMPDFTRRYTHQSDDEIRRRLEAVLK